MTDAGTKTPIQLDEAHKRRAALIRQIEQKAKTCKTVGEERAAMHDMIKAGRTDGMSSREFAEFWDWVTDPGDYSWCDDDDDDV